MSDIKNFIGVEPVAPPKKKARKKGQREYKVLVEDGENLAILRVGRPNQTLVLVPSKSLYYIDREGEQPYALDEDSLTKFLADVPDEGLVLTGTNWIDQLQRGKGFARDIIFLLRRYDRHIKTGFIRYAPHYGSRNIWNDSVVALYDADKKLFRYFMDRLMAVYQYTEDELIEAATNGRGALGHSVIGYFEPTEYLACIRALYGIDNARRWIDRFVRANMSMNMDVNSFIKLTKEFYDDQGLNYLLSPKGSSQLRGQAFLEAACDIYRSLAKSRNATHLNFDAFLDYVSTAYMEGFGDLDQFMRAWTDSIKLQKVIFGKIKERYPKHLASHHQVLIAKSRLLNALHYKMHDMDFDDFVASAGYLEWKPDWGSYEWSIPHVPGELIDEAEQQQNCLKGWLPELADNTRHLVFMRNKKTPDRSQITIEVSKDGRIGEIAGFMNRDPNAEELTNIRRWAKEKRLCMPGEAAPPPLDPPKAAEQKSA